MANNGRGFTLQFAYSHGTQAGSVKRSEGTSIHRLVVEIREIYSGDCR